MKILILQLARLGDIYQTWPVVRALRQQYGSDAVIDLVARERFMGATKGLCEVNQVFSLDSKKILAGVFSGQPKVQKACDDLDAFVSRLKTNAYDRIVNLSFSDFSSYLTESIRLSKTRVSGYSRFDDNFLDIPDEVSSYFFAQVGVGLFNRIHTTDLFAQVAGVELTQKCFFLPETTEPRANRILVHVGASAAFKTLTSHQWQKLLRVLVDKFDGEIVLIGSLEESYIGEEILASIKNEKLSSAVGKTNLQDLMKMILNSRLLIGADSAPVHMASLTGTPVLNISLPGVNFWETGPKSAGSQIIRIKHESEILEDKFIASVESILYDELVDTAVVRVESPLLPYKIENEESCFGWALIQSIYMQADLPYVNDNVMRQALLRLYESNQLAIEQINKLKSDPKNKIASATLERCDQIFSTIEKLCPDTGVLIRWIRTEKLRIPPGEFLEVLGRFQGVHEALSRLLEVYPLDNWYELKNGVLNDKDILDEA